MTSERTEKCGVLLAGRKVLKAVAILHAQGMQLLRIQPGMIPSGAHWRVKIGPAHWFQIDRPMLLPEYRRHAPTYSTFHAFRYFGWEDAEKDDAVHLAERIRRNFPEVTGESNGADPAYAEWFCEMLELTAPQGLIYAFADWGFPIRKEGLSVLGASDERVVPFPPPVVRS